MVFCGNSAISDRKPGHERPIDVIGDDDEVGPLRLHQFDQPLHRLGAHGVGRRVARVDEEKGLDALVGQSVDFLVRILPGVAAVGAAFRAGVDVHHLERDSGRNAESRCRG